jgi:hypothetical protein
MIIERRKGEHQRLEQGKNVMLPIHHLQVLIQTRQFLRMTDVTKYAAQLSSDTRIHYFDDDRRQILGHHKLCKLLGQDVHYAWIVSQIFCTSWSHI